MLAFNKRRQVDEKNLQMIFHVENVPCDTRMREILDLVDPEHLRPAFNTVFTWLQRSNPLDARTDLQAGRSIRCSLLVRSNPRSRNRW